MKLGLIADTHMPGATKELWPQVFDVFADVDAILHSGDLHTLEIVDRLSQIAPTWVAAGNGDVGIVDDRLQDAWALTFEGFSVGMIHRFPSPERKSGDHLKAYVERHFGQETPEILVYGHTHLESIHDVDGLLCINPGSPTLPRNQSLRLGTIGTLELSGGQATATIMQLTDHGAVVHREISPYSIER